jgi:hypothetical protein
MTSRVIQRTDFTQRLDVVAVHINFESREARKTFRLLGPWFKAKTKTGLSG